MKNKDLFLFLFFLLVNIWTISPVFADTIFLKSGGELTGGIVEESKDEVVIQLSFGNMTLKRSDIKKIDREGNEEYPNATVIGQKPTKHSRKKSSSRGKRKKSKKMGVNELVAELEETKLDSWERKSHKVTEKEKANYKVLRADGTEELVMEKPAPTDDVEKLWMKISLGRVDAGAVIYFTGVSGYIWRRLYLTEGGTGWTDKHPGLQAYKKVTKLSKELLKKIIVAGGGSKRDFSKIQSAANTLKSASIMKEEAVDKAYRNIEEITARVGDSWGGTEILRQAIALDYSQDVKDQETRIEVAKEKRDLLIQAAKML